MRKAALYIQGRIVLGSSHLDAFEQLSEDEKSSESLSSGFFDEETNEFQGYMEEEHFFNKEILLMRHGRVEDGCEDPDLSPEGHSQVAATGRLLDEMNLDGFMGFCSPMLRCLRTAAFVSEYTGVHFRVEPDMMEPPPFLTPGDSFFLPTRHSTFPQYDWPTDSGWIVGHETTKAFISRISQVLRRLPKRSIIISHSGFVINMAKLALCNETVTKCGVPTASLTHIENREVRCLGKNL